MVEITELVVEDLTMAMVEVEWVFEEEKLVRVHAFWLTDPAS